MFGHVTDTEDEDLSILDVNDGGGCGNVGGEGCELSCL